MIIKMVTIKLSVVHVARPKPMQIGACAWIYRWTINGGKSGLGRGPAFSKTHVKLMATYLFDSP